MEEAKRPNRCCIFAHFDRDGLVDDYVLYYLKALRKISSHIVFVSTSRLNRDSVDRLQGICSAVIVRENCGYDFMSWQMGLHSLPSVTDYDELVICNDSVYGPFYALESVFEAMQEKPCDFWGLTENNIMSYHLQSYFLAFRKPVLQSIEFRDFWDSIRIVRDKLEIVEKYEVGLSQRLMKANFKPDAYIRYQSGFWSLAGGMGIPLLLKDPPTALRLVVGTVKALLHRRRLVNAQTLNLTHVAWRQLILRHKMPFLKIDLLRDNPIGVDIHDYGDIIKRCSDYDVRLIENHLTRIRETGKDNQVAPIERRAKNKQCSWPS